jgi:peptide deformylase
MDVRRVPGAPGRQTARGYTRRRVAEVTGQVRNDQQTPEEAARRRAALAQIRQYGDPVLRLQAHEVDTFDGDLARLVERMKRLMAHANGVGLAANQVGVLRRVFVLNRSPDEEAIALVNPVLVERGNGVETDDEGCLSLQGVTCPVTRHCAVTVEAQDPDGRPVRLELDGLAARVAQHEIDHLDGVLILDRTTPEARREALGVLRPRLVLRASA